MSALLRHQYPVSEAEAGAAVSVLVPLAAVAAGVAVHGRGHHGRLPAHVRPRQVRSRPSPQARRDIIVLCEAGASYDFAWPVVTREVFT